MTGETVTDELKAKIHDYHRRHEEYPESIVVAPFVYRVVVAQIEREARINIQQSAGNEPLRLLGVKIRKGGDMSAVRIES